MHTYIRAKYNRSCVGFCNLFRLDKSSYSKLKVNHQLLDQRLSCTIIQVVKKGVGDKVTLNMLRKIIKQCFHI